MDAHMYEVWDVILMLMVQLETDFSRKQLYTKLKGKRETPSQLITTGEADRAARERIPKCRRKNGEFT